MDPKIKKQYKALTKPEFHCCLDGIDPFKIEDTTILAIGCAIDEIPVGLALASLHKPLLLGEIHSLYVHPEQQKQHIGTQLLAKLEEEALREGCNILTKKYPDNSPFTIPIEKILKRRGWQGPKVHSIRYLFDVIAFNPDWFQRPPKLPPDYTEFLWKEISKEEEKQLRAQQDQDVFPDIVSPYGPDEHLLEPLNSLGLRYKDEIIGWVITHRISPDTIKYSALYMQRKSRNLGYIIRLLIDAIQIQKKNRIPWALFEINLAETEPQWYKFVEQRLAPHAQSTTRVLHSWVSRSPHKL